jgi:peroxiredoxin
LRDIKKQITPLAVPGEIMPDFTLVSTRGTRVRLSDYRGRRDVVLVFSGRGNSEMVRGLLQRVSEQYPEFVSEETQVLAVVQGAKGVAELLEQNRDLPFLVLTDEESRVHNMAGALKSADDYTPVVHVIDRYGEIRHVFRTEQFEPVCTAAEILD